MKFRTKLLYFFFVVGFGAVWLVDAFIRGSKRGD